MSRRTRSTWVIRRSGLFDVDWYREQLEEPLPAGQDPVTHYLTVGSARRLSPHPLFDPSYYAATSSTAGKSTGFVDPFVEFLTKGCHRGDDPHPLFDTQAYLAKVPAAHRHAYGAFGHFLTAARAPAPLDASMARDLPSNTGGLPYLDTVRSVLREHRAVPDHTGFERIMSSFDHAAAASFVARMRAVTAGVSDPPTVSVVIPTKDRATVLATAIDSVQAQSYPHWELLVVDDGGSDHTGDLVRERAAADRRIRYLYQENTGVAGARNHGIRESRGELLAYLDSDNTWEPEFLEVMVGFLRDQGLRAAYCASQLHGDGRVEYRGREVNREALRERNYIDCITLVHERELMDTLGGFDDRLRRVVDWDLLIRIAEATELGYAPFIGTAYDLWDGRDDRISLSESVGYRHIVRDKHWVPRDAEPSIVPGRLSVVMSVGARIAPALTTLATLEAELGEQDHQLLVVDNGLEFGDAVRLRLLERLVPALTVWRLADPASVPVGSNLAAAYASGDVLLHLDPGVQLEVGVATRLAATVRERAPVLVQPTVVNPDGVVRTTGQVLGPRTLAIAAGAGLAPDDECFAGLGERGSERDGVEGFAFAVDTATFRQLRGLDPLFVRGGGDLDLGLRAAEHGVGTVHDTGAVVFLSQLPKSRNWSPEPADRSEFARRWRGHQTGRDVDQPLTGLTVTRLTPLPGESRGFPRRWAPVLARAPGDRRRWAIKTSAPNPHAREAWGDWHFACALRDALRELDEHAVVDNCQAWHRPTAELDDVNLVLRGTQRFEPIPEQLNLLWVISHPDLLTWYELQQYDQVFVASRTYPEVLANRWPDITAYPLLQCTDPERFHPEHDPNVAEDLLFVGNSRRVLRRAVRDAIEMGLRPAVYGSLWEGLIPAELIHGEHVPNEALNRYYATAGVVLNDHWDDMRDRGFLSNRLFDAVACGAVVVSDSIPGVEELFGGRVLTYSSADDLAATVERARERALEPSDVAERVVKEHTFTARAHELVAAADQLAAGRRPRPDLATHSLQHIGGADGGH